MNVRASVLIPAHNKPTTLPLTVDTVLRQTVADLEVIVIGDGVTDDVREVLKNLVEGDERVRFLDFPKGPHHGERYRHDAIMEARSDAIFYLCDDDLLLPEHVNDLLALLEDHDLVQSLNGWITPEGEVRYHADDLSEPEGVALILREELRFNSISITGTAHSRTFYEAVGDRWDTTPHGRAPDHHQFAKLLRHPACRAATSHRMTALQFPTSSGGRHTWSDEARAAELGPWYDLVIAPGAQQTIDRLGVAGALRQIVQLRRRTAKLRYELALSRRTRADEVAALKARLVKSRARLAKVRERLANQRRRAGRLRVQLDEERARAERRPARRLRRRLGRLRRKLRARRDSP